MNEVPETETMPEPPHVEGVQWIKKEYGWTSIDLNPVETHRLTDADLLDLKCSEMDAYNRYYR